MGKKLIIGFESALLVYRAIGAGLLSPTSSYHAPVTPSDCTTRVSGFSESGNIAALLDAGPLDIVARTDQGRHDVRGCRIHLLKGELPSGAFRQLGNDILITSPGLTLLQICQESGSKHMDRLPWCNQLIQEFGRLGRLVACAEMASELCGVYSIAPDGNGTMVRHRQYLTRDSLLLQLGGFRLRNVIRLAERAARCCSPLSASPRETQVYLVMTAPWPIGYGLPFPSTNSPVLLPDQSLSSDEDCRSIRFSDYAWPRRKLRNKRIRRPVTLEYDSDKHHTSSAGVSDQQLFDQAERRDAFEATGHGFLRLSTAHTNDFELFDAKMRQLATLLRIDLPQRSPAELEQARRFQELLFDSERFKYVGSLAKHLHLLD